MEFLFVVAVKSFRSNLSRIFDQFGCAPASLQADGRVKYPSAANSDPVVGLARDDGTRQSRLVEHHFSYRFVDTGHPAREDEIHLLDGAVGADCNRNGRSALAVACCSEST